MALYCALNPAQKQAVDTIDGPVMIIAGPGTGKTLVLTLRIANILRQTDLPPDAILALAFTRSAVAALRARLVEIIGSVGYRVKIHTFHSFCNEIIKTYPEYFPRIIGATAALPVDQIGIMKEVINAARLKLLKPFGAPDYYLYPALEAIDRLKKENITPRELEKLLRGSEINRKLERNRELLKLYRGYETKLEQRRLYDFNDMVMEVIKVLAADRDFRTELQEEFQYLLADEHQDANQGQNELLHWLTDFSDRPNLFIVGDAKQAIFQFQGASLDNFNYFRRLYPTAKIITLTDNYRSRQSILDAAHSLIKSSHGLDQAALAPLRAAGGGINSAKIGGITLRVFSNEAAEFNWLAQSIKEKLKSGLTADRLAVIFRDNRDAEPMVEIFEQENIPFIVESETNVLRDIDLRKLILLFRTIHYFGADDWLKQTLHLDFLNLPPLAVWRLITDGQKLKRPLYELLRSSFPRFYQKLERWHRLSHNANFTDLFGRVLAESHFLPYLLKKAAAADKLEKLHSFFAELKNILKANPDFMLTDFIHYLDLLEEQHIAINLKNTMPQTGIRLLTAHKAKGLEFDDVYIVRAYDGHFGNRRAVNFFNLPVRNLPVVDEEAIESERKLFYVALTRGRFNVAISYTQTNDDGRHRLPSQFLEEINKNLIETVTTADFEKSPETKPEKQFKLRAYQGASLRDKTFLNQLFTERGLSVTALNNYLACPLKYFFNNLLRVTKVQSRALLYGVAAHEALKVFFDRYARADKTSAQMLVAAFGRVLSRQPLAAAEQAEILAKGKRALTGFFKCYYPRWPRAVINEFKVRGVFLKPDLRLTGQIDKIEFLSTGGREVKVVDYKTGQPKSRREILGQNKNSTGDYWRQLVFYRLLLDNYDRGKYRAVSSELDFIEPNPKGEYKKERFELTDDAVAELKELVEKTVAEIRAFKFFHRGCARPSCEACTLWRLMGRKF
ncbi:MAG: ATP-dependent DNA helicase [Patescibacteria group bacterium]